MRAIVIGAILLNLLPDCRRADILLDQLNSAGWNTLWLDIRAKIRLTCNNIKRKGTKGSHQISALAVKVIFGRRYSLIVVQDDFQTSRFERLTHKNSDQIKFATPQGRFSYYQNVSFNFNELSVDFLISYCARRSMAYYMHILKEEALFECGPTDQTRLEYFILKNKSWYRHLKAGNPWTYIIKILWICEDIYAITDGVNALGSLTLWRGENIIVGLKGFNGWHSGGLLMDTYYLITGRQWVPIEFFKTWSVASWRDDSCCRSTRMWMCLVKKKLGNWRFEARRRSWISFVLPSILPVQFLTIERFSNYDLVVAEEEEVLGS